MKNSVGWIKAMRLRTLPLALSTVLTGSFVAFVKGKFIWLIFVFVFLTTVFLQILSNLANDYGDALKGTDNENRIGPERAIQSGLISVHQMKKAIILFSGLSFCSGILLLYFSFGISDAAYLLFFLTLGVGAIIAAIKYTVGKNAYGYTGLGDVFVFVFFGIVGVVGTQFLFVKSIELVDFLPAITIGALSTAVLNMNNMRDILNDAACGKNTLVVKMGFEKAKWYHTFLIFLAFVTWIATGIGFEFSILFYVSALPFLVLFLHLNNVWKTSDPKLLDSELKKIALSTFGISLLTWIMILL